MNENRLQVQLHYQEKPNRWVMTHRHVIPSQDVTLTMNIRHDWSKDPDDFECERWEDGDCARLVEDYKAYANMCHEHDDEVPDDIRQMSDIEKEIFDQMKERWTALNMLATFAVTW